MPPWNAAKAKVQLRLSVQRLRISQQKKEAQAKASRREIAVLLERGKVESARIKVEAIINEDIHVELLELLELYCELLIARFGLLELNSKEPDPGISEGVCSIVHAAQRTEVKELHVLREILMHKYGRDFSLAAIENQNGCVSERVTRKLIIETPSTELVDAYLGEIAKAYAVNWRASSGGGSSGEDGGVKEAKGDTTAESQSKSPEPDKDAKDGDEPAPRTRTPKLPDLPPTEDEAEGGKPNASGSSSVAKKPDPPPYEEDDFAALARRFEALKKR
ncbi:DUF292-domain-containing protein [Coniophora puteana RWD-64-598 SS2]|uniref:DUF292-domain-containing protein n=1 Tax=Coniophora puteana (strain RWD-64-598) TaxID=741705 RepID=A0A5M3N8B1_CONPW|nr:DUF292-domain-containing protein [Coniophora puteana RWD-64-598 SS2]EIW87091.1 DUF292-domain-containing protein [Coniophora puteana RWD-64-598 SS2]